MPRSCSWINDVLVQVMPLLVFHQSMPRMLQQHRHVAAGEPALHSGPHFVLSWVRFVLFAATSTLWFIVRSWRKCCNIEVHRVCLMVDRFRQWTTSGIGWTTRPCRVCAVTTGTTTSAPSACEVSSETLSVAWWALLLCDSLELRKVNKFQCSLA